MYKQGVYNNLILKEKHVKTWSKYFRELPTRSKKLAMGRLIITKLYL